MTVNRCAKQAPGLTRRRVLKAGIAAGSLFMPAPYAWVWAQSEGTLKLLRLPKLALVIGNNKYKEAPLKNPVNDARAIGEALKQSGFEVTTKLDAGRADLASAIQAYTQALASKKCVGLFYYAGHGIQLAWRNYMLPVDADIDTIADIQKQGVELNSLLEGINKASNPLNVIILDACRDNPFGSLKGVDHKGLSQMDAPHSTLLAYATAPGNTASDGTGANGLYTENLLREIKVPEAKVEDVFKRVRLNVRRSSNGQQIPWESTSLEEDFWFLPPKELRKLSEQEQEKRFDEELALWEKIKESKETGPLEDYLRRYPSGRFSELAQFQLDRVLAKLGEKKIEIVSSEGNPFTKGTARVDTNFKVGDSYSYRETDLFTKLETRTFTNRVTEITDTEVIFNDGLLVTDLFGNFVKVPNGSRFTGAQYFIPEYTVGKKWTTRFKVTAPNGRTGTTEIEFKVVARERVAVPAGSFEAYRVEGQGWAAALLSDKGGSVNLQPRYWIAAGIRRAVASETVRKHSLGKILNSERQELTAYTQT